MLVVIFILVWFLFFFGPIPVDFPDDPSWMQIVFKTIVAGIVALLLALPVRLVIDKRRSR